MEKEKDELAEELERLFDKLFSEFDNDASDDKDSDSKITLNDENGSEVHFEFLNSVEYKNDKYIVLLPEKNDDEDEDSREIVILKAEDTGNEDEEIYTGVDDKETYDAVFEIFINKI